MKTVTGRTLKIVAMITMFLDHVGAAFFERYILFLQHNGVDAVKYEVESRHPGLWMDFMEDPAFLRDFDALLRLIGRVSFPIFCFLLVEGFFHTRNVGRYLIRLFIFSIISELPFDYAFYGRVYHDSQNVFLTLFIGMLFMYFAEKVLRDPLFFKKMSALAFIPAALTGALSTIRCVSLMFFASMFGIAADFSSPVVMAVMALIGAALGLVIYFILTKKRDVKNKPEIFGVLLVLFITCALAFVLKTDYSVHGVLAIAVIWLCRKMGMTNKDGVMKGCILLFALNYTECTCFFSALLVERYNGEKGKYMKYLYYIFYPAHLTLLFCLRYLFIGV